MTEEVSSLLLGLVAGFILALIFTGMWFVHNLKQQEEQSLRALTAMRQAGDLKVEQYKEAHETITTNYGQFMEKRIQHEAAQGYAKGLSNARLCVRYLISRLPSTPAGEVKEQALNQAMERIGEKMQSAEDELEIRHKILSEHNHQV
ncbi:TMhelix containing protein [Vibrio phage 1.254.O._10N.286.45.C8]|nr:TMhelix containing protein [Vibrio phage 1.254.O._10N.286.45.C8]